MMKTLTYLMIAMMLLAVGCKEQTPEEIAEKQGRAMIKKHKQDIDVRIRELLLSRLEHPESYQPISTDLSIVTNNMIIYNTDAFHSLRDLNRSLKYYPEEYSNDSTSHDAITERNTMKAMVGVVCDKINAAGKRPVEYEGINAYHQFYVKDQHDSIVKKEYHFILHKDNRITLLSNHDEFVRVLTLLKQMINYPPYRIKWDSFEDELFSQVPIAWSNAKDGTKLW